MYTPHDLERQLTLLSAVTRYDELASRDALAPAQNLNADAEQEPGAPPAVPLSREEALELLALGEVIARMAGYGRQLAVRSARAANASWSQIGAALGVSKQAAWEAHTRWIDSQVEQHRRTGYQGFNPDDAEAARALAGGPDETDPGRAGR